MLLGKVSVTNIILHDVLWCNIWRKLYLFRSLETTDKENNIGKGSTDVKSRKIFRVPEIPATVLFFNHSRTCFEIVWKGIWDIKAKKKRKCFNSVYFNVVTCWWSFYVFKTSRLTVHFISCSVFLSSFMFILG